MPKININSSLSNYQSFIKEVYSLPNDRYFNAEDMLANIERFVMRALKGIRKNDSQKTKNNLLIAQSWFMSLMNQFHIDIESAVWQRFPYVCSYCGKLPCECKSKKVKKRQKITINNKLRPKTLQDLQTMFEKIYPLKSRTIEQAGIHLAEEMGELAESCLSFRGSHNNKIFDQIPLESADLFSCFMGVFNSLNLNIATELSKMFKNNCHVCKKSPCECSFNNIMNYRS